MKGSKEALNICAGALLKRIELMDRSAKGRMKILKLEEKHGIKPLDQEGHKSDEPKIDGPRISRTSAGGYVWK